MSNAVFLVPLSTINNDIHYQLACFFIITDYETPSIFCERFSIFLSFFLVNSSWIYYLHSPHLLAYVTFFLYLALQILATSSLRTYKKSLWRFSIDFPICYSVSQPSSVQYVVLDCLGFKDVSTGFSFSSCQTVSRTSVKTSGG
jgi:hypothetical protein